VALIEKTTINLSQQNESFCFNKNILSRFGCKESFIVFNYKGIEIRFKKSIPSALSGFIFAVVKLIKIDNIKI